MNTSKNSPARRRDVAEYIRDEPLTAMAIASAAGFVLGGGVTGRVGRGLIAMVGRTAFASLWPVLLAAMVADGDGDDTRRNGAGTGGVMHDNGRTDFQK